MTSVHLLRSYQQKYFNSHPHEEDDQVNLSNGSGLVISTHILTKRMTCMFSDTFWIEVISTHILTKRMTDSLVEMLQQVYNFNSHPHEEDDIYHTFNVLKYKHFNSHPHEEDDCIWGKRNSNEFNFNSHPHEEDDWILYLETKKRGISTHILTKRMTQQTIGLMLRRQNFNSHPHEEDDVKGAY